MKFSGQLGLLSVEEVALLPPLSPSFVYQKCNQTQKGKKSSFMFFFFRISSKAFNFFQTHSNGFF